ncbi:MAG: adenine phosphoribosyltransferase [Treponemataceae bacterium]|nr:adenine phosphoribosyltransferase [Treponemataceae bacterium]
MTDLEELDAAIRRVPDFPKPGILFYDITGVFVRPDVFRCCIDRMEALCRGAQIDGIAGVEARGFLFAAPLAERLGLPLVLIRKKGKLPGETVSCTYALEYGTAEVEAHKADIMSGKRYLVVDDLIATGGTLAAARSILEQGGAAVSGFLGVVGLPALRYEELLAPAPVSTLITYDGE